MIVFLTLCYCGVLAAAVYFKLIKLTLWWKVSPAAWMALLLIVLFIPMQWGAPSGTMNSYQFVVEIVPNVSGTVVEVPVRGLAPIKKGDVLFRIDPTPFQAKVDQANSQLENAKQQVLQLREAAVAADALVDKTEADIELAKTDERVAAAALNAAKATLAETRGKKNKVMAVRDDLVIQVAAGRREFERVKELVARKASPQSDLDVAEVRMTSLEAQLTAAEADVLVSDDSIARAQADVAAADVNTEAAALRLKQLVETDLPRVQAQAKEANLAANSMIGDEHTLVATAKAQLVQAEFDLTQTTVLAPSDGYVPALSLRPGQRVTSMPMRAWMSFVSTEDSVLVAGIPQYTMRHVEPGQKAEVTMRLYPGKVFSATVDGLVPITPEGQIQPSGVIVDVSAGQTGIPYGVRLSMDDSEEFDLADIPGGAVGTAAIYTDQAKPTHLIRRVMLRMEAWLNYIKPW